VQRDPTLKAKTMMEVDQVSRRRGVVDTPASRSFEL